MSLSRLVSSLLTPVYIRARLLEERVRSGVVWDPLNDEFIDDPYPSYIRLRERNPVHRSLLAQCWVVSRYEDVDRILRDHQSFQSAYDSQERGRESPTRAILNQLEPSLLDLDPPDHTRLRSLVNRAFTPRRVAQMESHIRETAHTLLDEVAGQDEFDLMSNLAALLPTVVIAEMIGVPTRDRGRFKEWSDEFARVLEPNLTEGEAHNVVETGRRFDEYFTDVIGQRRADRRDDLLSKLIEAEEEGDRLSTTEMLTTLRLLLVAGNETTTNLIGNGLLALLRHPAQLELLRREPERIPAAIEELLRFDSPVQIDSRFATTSVDVGDHTFAPGAFTVLLIGGANRDPAEFADPNELDVTRSEVGNISFGRGIHYCLGAPLARLEAKVAFEVLFERFEDIRLGSRVPRYKRNIVLRGLQDLNIRVQRRNGRVSSGLRTATAVAD